MVFFSFKMKTLHNGVKIFPGDYFLITFNNIGFTTDKNLGINGLTHLFEHYIAEINYTDPYSNAYTSLNEMGFFTKNRNLQFQKNLIKIFYDENYKEKLSNLSYYEDKLLKYKIRELESEYNYRKDDYTKLSLLNTLYGDPIYDGGRNSEFKDLDKVKKSFVKIWKSIAPKDISIMVPKKFESELILLLEKTFGTKKKTDNIEKITKEMILPPEKFENSYVLISDTLSHNFKLAFVFDCDDIEYIKLNFYLLILYSNFSFGIYITRLYDDIFVILNFNNLQDMKIFLYLLKDYKSDILDYTSVFTEFRKNIPIFNDQKIIEKLESMTLESKLNLANDFFQKLKKYLTEYGRCILFTPCNEFINNSSDQYDSLFYIDSCKWNIFFNDYNYSNIKFNNIFQTSNIKNFYSNYLNEKITVKLVAKSNEHLNNLPKLIINKNYLPFIIKDRDLDLIDYSNEEFLVNVKLPENYNAVFHRYKNICYNNLNNNYSIGSIKDYLNYDIVFNAFKSCFLLMEKYISMDQLFFLTEYNYVPKYNLLHEYDYKINNQTIYVKSPLNFVSILVKTNFPIDFVYLNNVLKYKGYIYTSYINYKETIDGYLYLVFIPTVFIEETVFYIKNFIDSYMDYRLYKIKYLLIINSKDNFVDFSSLNNIL